MINGGKIERDKEITKIKKKKTPNFNTNIEL